MKSFIALALAPMVSAFWRVDCNSRLLDARADPLINPGKVSGHVHGIAGGNGFGFNNMTFDQARNSTCSTCNVKEDFSNYWHPKLYYKGADGSLTLVPTYGDYMSNRGGLFVYYAQRNMMNETITAFPKGFRMFAGDPFKRNSTDDFASQAVQFTCLNYVKGSTDFSGLPNTTCADGIRARISFPMCWDGVNLDSANHKSHVAYPVNQMYASFQFGFCPSTHPVRLMFIFLEVVFNTIDFVWPDPTQQPFVFAQGDATGYGFHADFINGWDVDKLQQAANTCNSTTGAISECPPFTQYTMAEQQDCKVPTAVVEDIQGPLKALPGCNPITYGPGPATPQACTSPTIAVKQAFTDMTSKGWQYVGCAKDDFSPRSLTNYWRAGESMTVDGCLATCSNQGYAYAGLEQGNQCYCGSSIPSERLERPGWTGSCLMPCTGNTQQTCGGYMALSLYKSCSSGSCTNQALQTIAGGPPSG